MSIAPVFRANSSANKEIACRLKAALQSPLLAKHCKKDYASSFTKIGLTKEHAKRLSDQVALTIKEEPTINQIEHRVYALFSGTKVKGISFLETIDAKMAGRADIIFNQIKPHLTKIKGKVIDFGAGDGQISQRVRDKLNLTVDAYDINPFKSPLTKITVHPFNGKKIPQPKKSYEAAIITNVMHHEKNNENIIKELTRIVRRRLVVIETVPVGRTKAEIKLDRERTFYNDCLWNVFFHYARIPVPGTYETPDGWIHRFKKYGWECTYSKNLGVDQPTIADTHHLLVFNKE